MSAEPAKDLSLSSGGSLSAIDTQFLTAAKAEVQKLLMSEELELPRISSLASRIMRVASDPNVDVDKVVELVQTDEVLAGRILQLINSAYFSTRQEVQSLRHAIVLLGLKSVGDLIFSYSMKMKVFKCERYQALMQSVWEHAVAAAVATEVVSQLRGSGDEPGFMAGLLHDVGKPLVLSAIITTESKLSIEPIGPDLAMAMLDHLHCPVGALIARKWRSSEAVQDAVRNHSTYTAETKPLTGFVYCGSLIAHHVGFSYRPRTIDPAQDPGFVALNLADQKTFDNAAQTVKTHAGRMLSVY